MFLLVSLAVGFGRMVGGGLHVGKEGKEGGQGGVGTGKGTGKSMCLSVCQFYPLANYHSVSPRKDQPEAFLTGVFGLP